MAGSATKGARHAQPGARKIPAWVPDACTPTRSFPCCAARGAGVQTTPPDSYAPGDVADLRQEGNWPVARDSAAGWKHLPRRCPDAPRPVVTTDGTAVRRSQPPRHGPGKYGRNWTALGSVHACLRSIRGTVLTSPSDEPQTEATARCAARSTRCLVRWSQATIAADISPVAVRTAQGSHVAPVSKSAPTARFPREIAMPDTCCRPRSRWRPYGRR